MKSFAQWLVSEALLVDGEYTLAVIFYDNSDISHAASFGKANKISSDGSGSLEEAATQFVESISDGWKKALARNGESYPPLPEEALENIRDAIVNDKDKLRKSTYRRPQTRDEIIIEYGLFGLQFNSNMIVRLRFDYYPGSISSVPVKAFFKFTPSFAGAKRLLRQRVSELIGDVTDVDAAIAMYNKLRDK